MSMIEEAPASSVEWRPIETAPLDGTPVWVARHIPAWGWVRGIARWEGAHGIEGWIARGVYDPPGELGLAHPTHWMPLPEPPAVPADAWRPATNAGGEA